MLRKNKLDSWPSRKLQELLKKNKLDSWLSRKLRGLLRKNKLEFKPNKKLQELLKRPRKLGLQKRRSKQELPMNKSRPRF